MINLKKMNTEIEVLSEENVFESIIQNEIIEIFNKKLDKTVEMKHDDIFFFDKKSEIKIKNKTEYEYTFCNLIDSIDYHVHVLSYENDNKITTEMIIYYYVCNKPVIAGFSKF